jgi:heptosyltransferase I
VTAAFNTSRPNSICVLRLSAIGDTCHVVALVRALQRHWPETRVTWIIGRIEARLMSSLLPEIEFITIDKRRLWVSLCGLRRAIRGRRFDVLLHLQTSLRASLHSMFVPARVRLGFDRDRAREFQWLFTNAAIAARGRQHVVDAAMSFAEALGLPASVPRWDLAVPQDADAWAANHIAEAENALIISACSSQPRRNWSTARYAQLAAYAFNKHGLKVILCGSPTELERNAAAAIAAQAGVPVLNLVGQDTLPQLLALLARARVLVAPDSGPAHMATLVGTPVIGLYAATRMQRTGAYLSRQWSVDRYAEAAKRFRHRRPDQLKWTESIVDDGVMDLIEVAAVTERLDAVLAANAGSDRHATH